MLNRAYRIRWLRAADASRVAAVERKVHLPEHRAGTELIWAQLAEKDGHGGNISLGLFFGRQLVGYLLVFAMQSRREIGDFFDAPIPDGLDPDQPSIYASDFGVLPAHRSASALLTQKFAEVVRSHAHLRDLPLDAFGTDTYAEIWEQRSKLFARMGWRFQHRYSFRDPKLGAPMHWLAFERIRKPRDGRSAPAVELESPRRRVATRIVDIRSLRGLRHLRQSWTELLRASREPCVLQSYEYVSCWYKHVGLIDPLSLRIQMRGETAEAVALLAHVDDAPLGLQHKLWRNLVDDHAGICSPFIVSAGGAVSVEPLARELLSDATAWDAVRLKGLAAQDADRWRALVASRDDLKASVAAVPGWNRLAVANRAGLPEVIDDGSVLQIGTSHTAVQDLERFILLERSEEEKISGAAIAASSPQLALHRELAARHAGTLGMTCVMLQRDGALLAGAIGYEWGGRFVLTHFAVAPRDDEAQRLSQLLLRLRQALATRGTSEAIVFDPAACGSFGVGEEHTCHSLSIRRNTAGAALLQVASGAEQLISSIGARR